MIDIANKFKSKENDVIFLSHKRKTKYIKRYEGQFELRYYVNGNVSIFDNFIATKDECLIKEYDTFIYHRIENPYVPAIYFKLKGDHIEINQLSKTFKTEHTNFFELLSDIGELFHLKLQGLNLSIEL